MEQELMAGFNSFLTVMAKMVAEELKKTLPDMTGSGKENSQAPSQSPKYIRGNKALAEFLGINETTICQIKKKGVLDDAIKAQYGRIIIYDIEKALECLNHKPLKAGRPKTTRL